MCYNVLLVFSLLHFSVYVCYGNIEKLRFLEDVDERIIELLAKPKARNAEFILDQIDLFNHCLHNVIEIMRLKTPDFISTVRYYIEVGGPSCIQQPIDEEYLQTSFGWSDEKLHEFKMLFSDTYHIWNIFLETYKNMKVNFVTYLATEVPSVLEEENEMY